MSSGPFRSRVHPWYLVIPLLTGLAAPAIASRSHAGSDSGGAGYPVIKVLSNRADLISGGYALVQVLSPAGLRPHDLTVRLNGRDVTRRFGVRICGPTNSNRPRSTARPRRRATPRRPSPSGASSIRPPDAGRAGTRLPTHPSDVRRQRSLPADPHGDAATGAWTPTDRRETRATYRVAVHLSQPDATSSGLDTAGQRDGPAGDIAGPDRLRRD
jgi:hypothetical protein